MVYFIKSKDLNAIKIGYSKSHLGAIKRLCTMKIGNADSLDILTIIDESRFPEIKLSNSQTLERLIQRKFKHLHIRGEWFKAKEELLLFISDIIIKGQIPNFNISEDNLIQEDEKIKLKNLFERKNRQLNEKWCTKCGKFFISKLLDQYICDHCLEWD